MITWCRLIRSVIILVINKCYHSYHYRPHWTTLSPTTITKYVFHVWRNLDQPKMYFHRNAFISYVIARVRIFPKKNVVTVKELYFRKLSGGFTTLRPDLTFNQGIKSSVSVTDNSSMTAPTWELTLHIPSCLSHSRVHGRLNSVDKRICKVNTAEKLLIVIVQHAYYFMHFKVSKMSKKPWKSSWKKFPR